MVAQVSFVLLSLKSLIAPSAPALPKLEVAPFSKYSKQRVKNIQDHCDYETVADVRVPVPAKVRILSSENLIQYVSTTVFHEVGSNHHWDQDGIN